MEKVFIQFLLCYNNKTYRATKLKVKIVVL